MLVAVRKILYQAGKTCTLLAIHGNLKILIFLQLKGYYEIVYHIFLIKSVLIGSCISRFGGMQFNFIIGDSTV